MNIKQKEELKGKLEELEMLISCIDSSWTFDHSQIELTKQSALVLGELIMLCRGDAQLSLNLLIRMIKLQIAQIKFEVTQ